MTNIILLNRLIIGIFILLSTLNCYSATITVTNTSNSGTGSLRNALTSAGNADQIKFAITGTAPHVINLSSDIIITQNNLILDATTNADYTCGNPTVVINANANITIQGSTNLVKGISFRNTYLFFDTGDNNQLMGCWFNLNDNGTAASGNPFGASLVSFVNNSTGNIIGGTTCDTRNIFSMGGSATWQGALNITGGSNSNTFRGNYLGTDKTGMNLLNTDYDHLIYIAAAQNLTFDNNVISGSAPLSGQAAGCGIYCDATGSVDGLTVTNNKIGVRADGSDGGSNAWGNTFGGVVIQATTCNNLIFTGNIVCRNGMTAGSDIKKCGLYTSATSTSITINDNFIGVTPSYTKAGNYFTGIFIDGASSNITINNNVVGDNGSTLSDNDQSHGISLEQPCTSVSITNNYVGMTSTGADIGNYCSGITVVGGSGYTVTGNFIGFNKGQRTSIPNAGIVFTNTANVSIQNNTIGGKTAAGLYAGQRNMGVDINGGAGIFISGASALKYRIGGTGTSTQNIIAYNQGYGIEVQNGDYIEMRWNSFYCNGLKGIMLNYGTAQSANNNFGNNTVSITAPGLIPKSLSGKRPANSLVDVFGTFSCASSNSCIAQGENRFSGGTYTPSASGVAGTTWTYANNGSAMYNDLSALATGSGSDCSAGYCRTSEFSPCIDNDLPVSFLELQASIVNDQAILNWKTTQEINADQFVIEKSLDGGHFENIGFVKASGNTSTVSDYEFSDPTLIQGLVYYRLKEIDINGAEQYSPIMTLHDGSSASVKVGPNPNDGNFNIALTNISSDVNITILNLLGTVVYTKYLNHIAAYYLHEISFSDLLAKGIYILSVQSPEGNWVERVVVE
jgi:hypothetical protein